MDDNELLSCVDVEIKEEPFDSDEKNHVSEKNSRSEKEKRIKKNANKSKDIEMKIENDTENEKSERTLDIHKEDSTDDRKESQEDIGPTEKKKNFKRLKFKINLKDLTPQTILIDDDDDEEYKPKMSKQKAKKKKKKKVKKLGTVQECPDCNYSTSKIKLFKRHLDLHQEKPFNCSRCKFKAASQALLNRHLRTRHSNERIYKCEFCGKGFYREHHMVEHKRSHTGEKPYHCEICDYKTGRKSNLVGHLQTHIKKLDNELECDKCDYRAAYPGLLEDHKHVHDDEDGSKPYKCHLCNFISSRKGTLNGHMKVHEEEEVKANVSDLPESEEEVIEFQCEQCPYRSCSKKNYNCHLKTHLNRERKFECIHCSNKYLRKDSLHKHLRTHKEREYLCKFCVFSTIDKEEYKVHMKTHTKHKEFKCKTCEFTTNKYLLLQSHVKKIHLHGDILHCEFCEYKTKRRGHLVEHRRQHTGEKPFQCQYCDFRTARKSHLINHERTHTGEKPFKCDFCEYRSSRKCNLKDHQRTHTNNRPYPCLQCDYRAYTRSNLVTHQRTHTGEKPFQCTFCDFRAAQRSSLKTHLQGHTGEKRYTCEFCEYSTPFRGNLASHTMIHTGEKPYSCQFCEYKCSQKSALKSHTNIHTGEKPYKCTFCNFASAQRGSLNIHMQGHTGEKRYKCEVCSYTTSVKSNLNSHMNIHSAESGVYRCEYCEFSTPNKVLLMAHADKHVEENNFNVFDQNAASTSGLKTTKWENSSTPGSLEEATSPALKKTPTVIQRSSISPEITDEVSVDFYKKSINTVIEASKISYNFSKNNELRENQQDIEESQQDIKENQPNIPKSINIPTISSPTLTVTEQEKAHIPVNLTPKTRDIAIPRSPNFLFNSSLANISTSAPPINLSSTANAYNMPSLLHMTIPDKFSVLFGNPQYSKYDNIMENRQSVASSSHYRPVQMPSNVKYEKPNNLIQSDHLRSHDVRSNTPVYSNNGPAVPHSPYQRTDSPAMNLTSSGSGYRTPIPDPIHHRHLGGNSYSPSPAVNLSSHSYKSSDNTAPINAVFPGYRHGEMSLGERHSSGFDLSIPFTRPNESLHSRHGTVDLEGQFIQENERQHNVLNPYNNLNFNSNRHAF